MSREEKRVKKKIYIKGQVLLGNHRLFMISFKSYSQLLFLPIKERE